MRNCLGRASGTYRLTEVKSTRAASTVDAFPTARYASLSPSRDGRRFRRRTCVLRPCVCVVAISSLFDLRHALAQRTHAQSLARAAARREVQRRDLLGDQPNAPSGSRERRQLAPKVHHERRRRLVALDRHRVLLDDAMDPLHEQQRLVERLHLDRADRVELRRHYFTRSSRALARSRRPTFPSGLPFTCTMSAVKSNCPS